MKILLINHFPLEGSGSGTYTRNVAVHLTKLGHQVSVIFPENLKTFSIPEGINAHPVFFTGEKVIEDALPFNFPCFTTHPRSRFTFYELTQSQAESYWSAFEGIIKQEIESFKPDLIHVQHIWILSYLVSKLNLPYLITAHGTDLMGYRKSEKFRSMARTAAEKANRIITISKDIEHQVVDIFPICNKKTILLKNGFDNTIFYPEASEKGSVLKTFGIEKVTNYVVLFVGKLTHFKGVDVLIKAAKHYHKELGEDICTLIVGDGELSDTLQSLAESLHLKNLYFLGHQTQDVLRHLYNIADVSVFPSRREPFGLVAIEALACGSPVVATAEGGLLDIINDNVGSLVPVEDEVALSDAISHELNRPDHQKRREQAKRYAYENYSQDKIIGELINVYEKILKGK